MSWKNVLNHLESTHAASWSHSKSCAALNSDNYKYKATCACKFLHPHADCVKMRQAKQFNFHRTLLGVCCDTLETWLNLLHLRISSKLNHGAECGHCLAGYRHRFPRVSGTCEQNGSQPPRWCGTSRRFQQCRHGWYCGPGKLGRRDMQRTNAWKDCAKTC